MSAIFGGSKQQSSSQSTQTSQSHSYNQAYAPLSQAYTPTINQGTQATSQVANLLGVGGDPAVANAAFDNYRKSTDYDFTLNQGNQNITNSAAVNGSLGSGATLKALQAFGQQTAQKYLGDYITRLLGVGSAGTQAGQLLASTGGVSDSSSSGQSNASSTGSSTGGLAAFVGAGASSAAKGS